MNWNELKLLWKEIQDSLEYLEKIDFEINEDDKELMGFYGREYDKLKAIN